MKNTIVIATFAAAVKAKVEKADAMGTKTSWDTADHLKALARAVAQASDPHFEEAEDKGAAYVATILEVLEDGYNVSGFAQTLEKAYAKQGHFQRASKKAQTPNALYAALGITS